MTDFHKYKCKNNACDVWYFTTSPERLPDQCGCGHVLDKQPTDQHPVSLDSLALNSNDIDQDIRDHGYFKAKGGIRCPGGENWVTV